MSENVNNTNSATSVVQNAQNKVDEAVKANEPAVLEMEPLEFPIHTQGYITNTMKLSKLVSELFAVFNEYQGCRIYSFMGPNTANPDGTVNPNAKLEAPVASTMCLGNLYVDLFFSKDNTNSSLGWDALELVSGSNNGGTSMMDRLRNVCSSGAFRTYNVTKETKEALLPLLSGYGSWNFNPAWECRIQEIINYQQVPYATTQTTIVKIAGLSLDAIMGTIYGLYVSDEEKEADKQGKNPHYDYHCVVLANSMVGMNPMMYGKANYDQQYVIQVLRNDRAIINDTREAIGIAPMTQPNGYIPFNRNV